MAESAKQQARRLLADVPEEFVFRCGNGCILHNMRELADELKSMPEETYAFHVNAEKNDFVNWVRDIIKDDTLVKALQKASSRSQAASAVENRVASLAKKR
ncbi:MAG: hypothetical protein C4555_01175 [Dehalococcoidia bacterium]|nr:MAG: hypothetical protein C4555_01175 [Dehalococcoidia bacterium]